MSPEPQRDTQDWTQRLYDSYVSSGHAGKIGENPEDTFRPRQAYINHIIKRHFPPSRTAKILDIGCGHGAFLYFLSKAGFMNAHGIDISPEQITEAAKLGIANVSCESAVNYLQKIQDAQLDVVLLFDILEHLDGPDLLQLLDEVYRVLCRGGLCLIHVPNGEGIFGMGVRWGDLTHSWAFTQGSARQMLLATGFSHIESFEERTIPHGIKSLMRRLIWEVGTFPFRLLYTAESGSTRAILSANFLVSCKKS